MWTTAVNSTHRSWQQEQHLSDLDALGVKQLTCGWHRSVMVKHTHTHRERSTGRRQRIISVHKISPAHILPSYSGPKGTNISEHAAPRSHTARHESDSVKYCSKKSMWALGSYHPSLPVVKLDKRKNPMWCCLLLYSALVEDWKYLTIRKLFS